MSRVVCQGACPKCSSSDAYTTYEDGSGYCFSCSYVYREKIRTLAAMLSSRSSPARQEGTIILPPDVTSYIPPEPMAWVKQYGITNEEIRSSQICWSQEKQMLIYPVFEDGETLSFWQGRYFPLRDPKTYSCGSRPTYHTIGNPQGSTSLVFVEDWVSATKVARVCPAGCLFGSSISQKAIVDASKQTNKLIIWLDADKTKQALKYQQQYRFMFRGGITVVRTDLDPKLVPMTEIERQLNV